MNAATLATSAVPASEPGARASSVEVYNDTVVRQFTIMTDVWGIVGMSIGALIAAQRSGSALNFDPP